MSISRLLRSSRVAAVAVAVGAGLTLIGAVPHAADAAAAAEGVDCLAGAGGTSTFDLTARSGFILTPDGNTIYSWGFAGASGAFQLPGPTLCVTAGETVTVVLHNTLKVPTSIVFPGQVGVEADGQPAAPQFTSTAAGSLVQAVAGKTGTPIPSITYTFVAGQPGSYLYESGTDQRLQKQMGLYGALVVRPTGHDDWVYDDAATRFATPANSTYGYRQEYLQILSEVDPVIHLAVERNRAVNWSAYKPRYFLINGRAMPDTLAPNGAPYLPAQPYGATVHIRDAVGNPLPAVIRYLNAGPVTYPFHPHGNSQKVIGRDGRELTSTPGSSTAPSANGTDLGYDKFLIEVGPGQTVDTTLTWTNVENWNPTTGQIKTPLPNQADLGITGDTWWSQSPYLGFTSELPAGVTSYNTCGEYYHVAHSHALQQSTNFGAAFGGMMTLIRIDPSTPVGC